MLNLDSYAFDIVGWGEERHYTLMINSSHSNHKGNRDLTFNLEPYSGNSDLYINV